MCTYCLLSIYSLQLYFYFLVYQKHSLSQQAPTSSPPRPPPNLTFSTCLNLSDLNIRERFQKERQISFNIRVRCHCHMFSLLISRFIQKLYRLKIFENANVPEGLKRTWRFLMSKASRNSSFQSGLCPLDSQERA